MRLRLRSHQALGRYSGEPTKWGISHFRVGHCRPSSVADEVNAVGALSW